MVVLSSSAWARSSARRGIQLMTSSHWRFTNYYKEKTKKWWQLFVKEALGDLAG